MDRSRMTRQPTTPGEILWDEFLMPLHVTRKQLADHIGQDVKVINRIVNGKSAVTAEVALKLAAALGTTPDFWLNAQKGSRSARRARQARALADSKATSTAYSPSADPTGRGMCPRRDSG